MADPTIQTFCCHRSNNKTDLGLQIIEHFDTDFYNTLCMLSSTMGIFGALYQVLPRKETKYPHRWQNRSAARSRNIIVWLAIADLLASLGVFIRSALWLNYKNVMPTEDDTSSVIFCAVSSAWTQYFYMATWIWTLCYAVDMKLLLRERPARPFCYHTFAWICPAFLTASGLALLYIPDAKCANLGSLSMALVRILPNYCVTYILLSIVMIASPALYVASSRALETAVTCSLAQITSRERKLVQTIQLKFALINLVYYVCWLPNFINGIVLWTLWCQLPVQAIITLWYIMAVTNPLQAFFNALVYRRWSRREKFRMEWWYKLKKLDRLSLRKSETIASNEVTESSHLLQARYACTPHTSINGSSSI